MAVITIEIDQENKKIKAFQADVNIESKEMLLILNECMRTVLVSSENRIIKPVLNQENTWQKF